jgi:hypothetical protein
MDTLIEKIKSDRLLKFYIGQLGLENNPADFKIGDKVVCLYSIDGGILDKKIQVGDVGYIDNIMHRYKGEPAEHYEFWVPTKNGRTRYESYNIINYDQVEKFLETYPNS